MINSNANITLKNEAHAWESQSNGRIACFQKLVDILLMV
jgi:hypothetical protein